MSNKNFRIPYKGSKNKIADNLIDKMLELKPKAKYFIDFFGGGASMSFKAMEKGLRVIYNDKDERMVELLKLIKDRIVNNKRSKYGLFPEEYYNFIDRKTFCDNINKKTAYSGFVGACYSFGNDFKTYFCSREKEEYKKLLHNVIVFNCKLSLKLFNEKYNCNICLSDKNTINERRLEVLQRLQRLQQLLQLQQLQRLQRLEGLEELEILNLSYDELLKYYNFIDEEVILYCDPPYKNTGKYKEEFDYDKFINYLTKSKYTFFVSEYFIEDFIEIFSIGKRQTFSSTNNSELKQEKLYINGL